MHPGDPKQGQARPRRPATMLESVEEIRANARRPPPGRAACPRRGAPGHTGGIGARGPDPAVPADETPPVGPALRLDDGDSQGEVVRIRVPRFVIGRAEGDFLVPHDSEMSGRHAEVVRAPEGGRYLWTLRDLQSTNGTFVRASSSALKHGQEILLGGCRLRFDAAPPAAEPAGPEPVTGTQKWQHPPAPAPNPARTDPPPAALVVLTPHGEGRRYPLAGDELAIGRDPSHCSVMLDDPMVSPLHARIVRDGRGRWAVHNERSLNGLWVRVQEMPLECSAQFQCGEQRFLIRFP